MTLSTCAGVVTLNLPMSIFWKLSRAAAVVKFAIEVGGVMRPGLLVRVVEYRVVAGHAVLPLLTVEFAAHS